MDQDKVTPIDQSAVARQAAAASEGEIEIDLLELARVLLDKAHYIALFFMLGAVLFNAYAYFFIHPTYESTAAIYVVNASGGTVVDLTDLNLGTSLKNDYSELIMSYPVLDRVSKKLDLGWTTARMAGAIKVTNPRDTRILKLTAKAESPELAMNIANMLATVVVDYLPETMSTEAPNIAQKARLPERRAEPSYMKYTAIGGILGALICCAWFVVRHILDDTIRSEEDMEKYFGSAPLTAIPYSEALEQRSERQSSGKSGGRHGKDGDSRDRKGKAA